MAGIAHLVVRVTDWKASAAWYTEVLGFERHRGDGFSVFRQPGGTFGILLLPTDAEVPPSSSPAQRLDHLALHVPSREALENWQAALHERYPALAIDELPGIGASITLHDPDGLEIELFCPAGGSILHAG